MLQRVAACCSVLQRVAARFDDLLAVACSHSASEIYVLRYNQWLWRVAVCCTMLRHAVACCSVLR